MTISWGKAVIATAGMGLLSACGHSSTSSAPSQAATAMTSTSTASPTSVASSASSDTSSSTDSDSHTSSKASTSSAQQQTSGAENATGSSRSRVSASDSAKSSTSHAAGTGGATSGVAKTGSSNSSNAKIGQQTSSSASAISIPSIGLNHGITAGGLNGGVLSPNPGEIEQFVGYGRVAPGKNGISVIAGHVTYNGPDVFYRLGDVPVGGKVTITFANGTHEDFVVTNKASINKDALTNDERVWGSSASPVLVLVTCDANSGWANAQHHVNNLVVWARPA